MNPPKGERKRSEPPDARGLAVQVLSDVHRRGAFAARALDETLAKYPALGARDRALTTEIVYGCLRCHGWLWERVARYAKRPLAAHDPVALHLMVGAYQLLVLDKIPAHAAVNSAVEAARQLRDNKVAGFVNAVLRRMAREESKTSLDQAAWASLPSWLQQALLQSVGDRAARSLLAPASIAGENTAASARTCVRLRERAEDFPNLTSSPATKVARRARRLERAGDPRRLPGYAEGAFVVQEEGSQVVGQIVSECAKRTAHPKLLDACAGHGSKTLQLADELAGAVDLWAADNVKHKLAALEREFQRLSVPLPHLYDVDWSQPQADLARDFDGALVDAPCSGTGTLWRRPEIVLRLERDQITRLAAQAATILENVLQHVKPGGHLVYAVCSVLREEGEAVVERFGDDLEPLPLSPETFPGLVDGQAHQLRLLPDTHGTDGFFIAQFRRRG